MHWLDTRRPSSSFFRCSSLSSWHDCRQHFICSSENVFKSDFSPMSNLTIHDNDDECIITCYAIVWTERRAHVRLNSGKSRKCPFIRIDYLDLTIYHNTTHNNALQWATAAADHSSDSINWNEFSSLLFSLFFALYSLRVAQFTVSSRHDGVCTLSPRVVEIHVEAAPNGVEMFIKFGERVMCSLLGRPKRQWPSWTPK